MQIDIFVLDGGRWDGQYSFDDWNREDQHRLQITVPEGSELVAKDQSKVLRTGSGKELTAVQVLNYCRMGVAGYRVPDSTVFRHFESGRQITRSSLSRESQAGKEH